MSEHAAQKLEDLTTPEEGAGHEVPLAQRVFECPMEGGNTAGAGTVGEFLGAVLKQVWIDGAGFDPKRPFPAARFSGWKHEIYGALVENGLLEDMPDFVGQPYSEEQRQALLAYTGAGDALVADAIQTLLGPTEHSPSPAE